MTSTFGVALDAVDQVARHVSPEIAAADEQVAPRRVLGEEQRRLAGRVAAADDRDRIAGGRAAPRSASRRSRRSSPRTPRAARPAACGSARRWRSPPCGRAARSPSSSRRRSGRRAASSATSHGRGTLSRAPNFSAWIDGPLGQLGARDAGREAEVVLDPRRGAGLAARGDGVDGDGRRAPRRRRRPPPRGPAGPGADDDQVAASRRSSRRWQPDQRGASSALLGLRSTVAPPR